MLRGAVSHRVIWGGLAPYTSSGTRKLMCKHLSLRTPSSVHGLIVSKSEQEKVDIFLTRGL